MSTGIVVREPRASRDTSVGAAKCYVKVRFAASPPTPIIMLAAGSGIASMRGSLARSAPRFSKKGKAWARGAVFRLPPSRARFAVQGGVGGVGCDGGSAGGGRFSLGPDGTDEGKKGEMGPGCGVGASGEGLGALGAGGCDEESKEGGGGGWGAGSWRRRSGWKGRRGMGGL